MAYIQNRVSELMAEKARVEHRKITLDVVAEETGISKSSVHNWTTNKITRFDGPQIAAFCLYFNCQPNDLFVIVLEEGDDSPESESSLVA